MGEPWPKDTEQRRVESLREFFRQNPNYLDTLPKEEQDELRQYQSEQESKKTRAGKKTYDGTPQVKGSRKPPSYNNENKWDVGTTLELLDSMKDFVIRHEASCIGVNIEKWKEVSCKLTNPRQMEWKKFARSCQVRYDNLRRYWKAGMTHRIGEPILRSYLDYRKTCKRFLIKENSKSDLQLIPVGKESHQEIGYCNSRKVNGISTHSGLITIDSDVENDDRLQVEDLDEMSGITSGEEFDDDFLSFDDVEDLQEVEDCEAGSHNDLCFGL